MKVISIATIAALLLPLAGNVIMPDDWDFIGRRGTVWVKKPAEIPLVDKTEGNSDVPSLSGICQEKVPRLEYLEAKSIPEGEKVYPMYSLIYRIGKWSVRPLHIWGYEDVWHDECKFILGWGTAFVLALIEDKIIWVTVDHNVQTDNYWERTVATNWFVRTDDGQWQELLPIGCKEMVGAYHQKYGKYCLLISASMPLMPVRFDDDYIVNDIKALENTYLYGCSVMPERVVRWQYYRIHHFCLGNWGYVNSPFSLPLKIGGDILVSNPAMPGFSGSPLLVYREEEWLLVGVVNSGLEGVFTAVQFLDEGIIPKIKEWFKSKEQIWR